MEMQIREIGGKNGLIFYSPEIFSCISVGC